MRRRAMCARVLQFAATANSALVATDEKPKTFGLMTILRSRLLCLVLGVGVGVLGE